MDIEVPRYDIVAHGRNEPTRIAPAPTSMPAVPSPTLGFCAGAAYPPYGAPYGAPYVAGYCPGYWGGWAPNGAGGCGQPGAGGAAGACGQPGAGGAAGACGQPCAGGAAGAAGAGAGACGVGGYAEKSSPHFAQNRPLPAGVAQRGQ